MLMPMTRTTTTINSWILVLTAAAVLTSACGPNQRILESANANTADESSANGPATVGSSNTPAVDNFEKDLNAMRTADFKFIVVFRRKDGQALDAADKALIAGKGSQANRRRLSDEGRAVIIGSNFPFVKGEFESLTERFKMDNFSKPDSGPMFSNTAPANESR